MNMDEEIRKLTEERDKLLEQNAFLTQRLKHYTYPPKARQYYYENREEISARRKELYKINREAILAKRKEWYRNLPQEKKDKLNRKKKLAE